MADNDPNGDGGNIGSSNDSGLSDGNSYGGSFETSAGGKTSYGESSEPGAIAPTETPGNTSDTGDAAPQNESTGYSYSVTPDGQFVLHSPSGSELYGRTPDGRHIMRHSDGSLLELHFGDEHGRMRSTPYYEQKPARDARTAVPGISTASLLDDFWFYNRDTAQGYKKFCAARRSREVDEEIAAYGLGPDPVGQTPVSTLVAVTPPGAAEGSPKNGQQPQPRASKETASNQLKNVGDANQAPHHGEGQETVTISPALLNKWDQEKNADWWSKQTTKTPGNNSIALSAPPQQIVRPWKEFDADVASGNAYYFQQNDKFYAKQGDTLFQGTDGPNGDIILTPVPADEVKDIILEYATKNGYAFTYEGQDYILGKNDRVYKLMREDTSEHYYLDELPREEGIKINNDYAQQKFEQGPPPPGLEDAFNPLVPWGNLLTRGPIQKRLTRVATGYVSEILKPYAK